MLKKLQLHKPEILALLKCWLLIAIIFALAVGFSINVFLVSLITVGIGFLFHELAHKFTAQKMGYQAEFKPSHMGVMVGSLIAALCGIIIIAPGAVVISGVSLFETKKYGKIAFAGPLTNALIAIMFIILALMLPGLSGIFLFGIYVNAWIGLFNCLPFWMFDGKKIFNWNKVVYFILVGILLILLLISRLM